MKKCLLFMKGCVSHEKKVFSNALNSFEENTYHHAWALYFKLRCKMETGRLITVDKELDQIPLSLKEDPNYTIFLETLRHIIRLNKSMSSYNQDAIEYLEEVSIPYFIKHNYRLEALECYKLLLKHFGKTNRMKKSLMANEAMVAIYERMCKS